MIGSYFGSLRESNIKFSVEKFAILIIALTVTMIGMFNIFDDNIWGVNKVVQVEVNAMFTNKTEFKHIEDENIIIKNRYTN